MYGTFNTTVGTSSADPNETLPANSTDWARLGVAWLLHNSWCRGARVSAISPDIDGQGFSLPSR